MASRTDGGERRRFARIAFHRPAVLTAEGRAHFCGLLDLSLKGALLEVPPEFDGHEHESCTLDIRLDDAGEVRIRMDGSLVHLEGDHVGFICREIDLESIEHLRRFVELNLGDEDEVHRELGALVSSRHL